MCEGYQLTSKFVSGGCSPIAVISQNACPNKFSSFLRCHPDLLLVVQNLPQSSTAHITLRQSRGVHLCQLQKMNDMPHCLHSSIISHWIKQSNKQINFTHQPPHRGYSMKVSMSHKIKTKNAASVNLPKTHLYTYNSIIQHELQVAWLSWLERGANKYDSHVKTPRSRVRPSQWLNILFCPCLWDYRSFFIASGHQQPLTSQITAYLRKFRMLRPICFNPTRKYRAQKEKRLLAIPHELLICF